MTQGQNKVFASEVRLRSTLTVPRVAAALGVFRDTGGGVLPKISESAPCTIYRRCAPQLGAEAAAENMHLRNLESEVSPSSFIRLLVSQNKYIVHKIGLLTQ